jgi:hypothetical protein
VWVKKRWSSAAMTARANQLSFASLADGPQLVRAFSMASVPSPSTVNWPMAGCTAKVASGSTSWPRSASVPPMRARCSSGSVGTSTAYQRAMGASCTLALSCRFFGVSLPSQWPCSGVVSVLSGMASKVPASVLPSRRTVATSRSTLIGWVPSAGTSALQGTQLISSSSPAGFQPKRTVPKRVSREWPSR